MNILDKKIPFGRVLYLLIVVGSLLAVAFFCQTFVSGRVQQMLLFLACVASVFFCARDRDKLAAPVGAFLLILFYLWAVLDQNMAFRNGLTSSMCFTWVCYFGCAMVVSFCLGCTRKYKWMGFFWHVMLCIGVFYAIVTIACWLSPSFHDAIYQRFFLSASIAAIDWKAGFTNHYSTNGMYLALGLIACIPLLLDKNKHLVLRVAPLTLILVALLLTTKRAHLVFGLGSVALAMVLYGSQKKMNTLVKAFVVAAIAMLVLYIISIYVPDLLGVFDRLSALRQEDNSADDRSFFVLLCDELWRASPAFGGGMGTFAINFNATGISGAYINQGFTIMYAHNCYWQVLAEQGLIGLVLLVSTFSSNLVGSVRLLLRMNRQFPENRANRAFLSASVALQIFFILYCFTGNPLYDMQTYIPYLLSSGVYFAVRRQILLSNVSTAGSEWFDSGRRQFSMKKNAHLGQGAC